MDVDRLGVDKPWQGDQQTTLADRPELHPVRFNTAVMFDSDSVFHGIDRVGERDTPIPPLRPGMKLNPLGNGTWNVTDDGTELARYDWSELRFSVSWKGYAFRDEDERRTWRESTADLTTHDILAMLTADLQLRGLIGDQVPERRELAILMITEYVRFPETKAA